MWISGSNAVWTSHSASRMTRTPAAYVATALMATWCAAPRWVRRAMAVSTTRTPAAIASRSSIPEAELSVCDQAATGSGSQDV